VNAPCQSYQPTTDEKIERCRREIADVETQLLAGHPDVEGLCLALRDWSWELRRLLDEAGEGK
jgi:hypothetical protein